MVENTTIQRTLVRILFIMWSYTSTVQDLSSFIDKLTTGSFANGALVRTDHPCWCLGSVLISRFVSLSFYLLLLFWYYGNTFERDPDSNTSIQRPPSAVHGKSFLPLS